MREYGFELRLCAHLETVIDGIVARQVGGGVRDAGGRVLDTVVIEPGPDFDTRRRITAETIPPAAIFSEVGVGEGRRWRRVTDLSPEAATRVRERALEVGFFERVRRDGEVRVRQTVRYPDWIGSITAIENKPDLGEPGDLERQLRTDVALGLVDRVVLATGSYVTGAHLNRIPEEVGVWRVHPDEKAVEIKEVRPPTELDADGWGLEVGEGKPLKREVRPVSPPAKRRARIRLAERAYGKGWRPSLPGCTEMRVDTASRTPALPFCEWKGRIVNPGACGPDCPGFDAAGPPAVDHEGERERRTEWKADPGGLGRRQAGVEEFGASGE